MARAALLSLNQTTLEMILDTHINSHKKQQIRSIHEPFIFLQQFVADFPEEAKKLDVAIRDAANKATEMIASLRLNIARDGVRVFIARLKFGFQVRLIVEETASIAKEAMLLQNNRSTPVNFDGASSSSASACAAPTRLAPINFKADCVVGLHEDLVAMQLRLCGESSNLQVIPIVGMGGIGKTTLAKLAYDDPMTMQHFDVRAWVTVTQDYSAEEILSCLFACVEFLYKERGDMMRREVSVGEKVFRTFKYRRYLIVLDDIWSKDAWDEIQTILPQDDNGSRVMLTTRLSDVAAYPDSSTPLHHMRFMDENQSWDLLQQKVFDHQDCPRELVDIGKLIARSCRGLPLALVVVAGLLSTVATTPASWGEIAENVHSVAIDGQTEKILLLSYTHLPHHLQSCLLYMGLFPEDCEVRVSKLIKLWVAEGILRSTGGSRSFEEEAGECLNQLVKRSLVLVTKSKSDGGIKSCSHLLRDLCIVKAQEDKFLVNLSSKHVVDSIHGHCRASVAPPSLHYLTKTSHGFLPIPIPYFQKIRHAKTMSTILCSGHVSVAKFFNIFVFLRVLDAGEACLTSLPNQLYELVHLVYLAIYYLGRISPAISNLQYLQTLILHSKNEWRLFRAQSICLPQEIWRMPRLRHLVFYGRLPDPERSAPFVLSNLQTLALVSQDMCTPRILVMIPNVKKLEIHSSGAPESEIFMKHLVHLHKLENLKICSYFSYETWHRDKIAFPVTLKKLTLSRVPLPWDEMSAVGSLPNLQVLKLTHQACKGETWVTCEEEFQQLEFLLIETSDLQQWITESSHFPRLKWLVLDDCWQLMEIPEAIGEVPTLQVIEVKGRARKSLVESANKIVEIQKEWGNDALQFRCMTHR